MRKSQIAVVIIVLVLLIVGVLFYPYMPEKMASHWNDKGQVDGYISKFWGLFLMPLILAAVALLLFVIPKIDPLKANIEKFRKYYDGFIIAFSAFMLCIHFFMILWNLDIKISPNAILPIGIGLLFFYVGVLCEHTKRNWFIGIKTPWTLSSEIVWDKTHKIGGKLFKIAGVIIMVGVFFQNYVIFFILIPTSLVAAYTIVYSYVEYRKVNK